jgi:hypothetical protein
VVAEETFATLLEAELRKQKVEVEVVNADAFWAELRDRRRQRSVHRFDGLQHGDFGSGAHQVIASARTRQGLEHAG